MRTWRVNLPISVASSFSSMHRVHVAPITVAATRKVKACSRETDRCHLCTKLLVRHRCLSSYAIESGNREGARKSVFGGATRRRQLLSCGQWQRRESALRFVRRHRNTGFAPISTSWLKELDSDYLVGGGIWKIWIAHIRNDDHSSE
jgi:hypothetical protein